MALVKLGQLQGNALIVGASRGIGLEFVRQLSRNDQIERLYAACRSPETATELLKLAEQEPKLQLLPLDVTEEAQIQSAIGHIQTQTPQLHAVINCVGLLHDGDFQPEKGLRQIDTEKLLRYFQVNSISAILLAKHLVPLFKHTQPSLLATLSAKVGSIEDNQIGGWYGYRASKAAQNMLMKNAAIEYKRSCPNTIIAQLHPGTTDTQLSQPFQRNVPPEKLFSTERTVTQLLDVLAGLSITDSGNFWSWNGDRLPW
jgi:NAD(P)-dependent dehydrogenase (short-subunit alcohol dehydrogenase family)